MRRKFVSPDQEALHSISLLRCLAVELVLEPTTFVLPTCRQKVVVKWNNRTAHVFHEEVCWALPVGSFADREPQAAINKPVARIELMGLPEYTIGLWVQIGELTPIVDDTFDSELVYHCPAPPKGIMKTRSNAELFLHLHRSWHWQRMPDVYGAVAQARQRLQNRVATYQAVQIAKLQQIQPRLQSRAVPSLCPPVRPVGPQIPGGRTRWTKLRKGNTPYFAYQMCVPGEFWIVMVSSDHAGYYVVPGSGPHVGWEEALPASIGRAEVDKGAYRGNGPVDRAIRILRELGVIDSFIDSDIERICEFTGYVD